MTEKTEPYGGKNPLAYDHEKAYLPEDCDINISPSKFSTYIDKKYKWYREVVLGEDGFTGSTASVIGTVVHYIAECVGKKIEVDKDAIYAYIKSYDKHEDVDTSLVTSEFEQPASALINDYVLVNIQNFLEVEKVLVTDLDDGIYVSGKLDLLEGTKDDCCITDYKTYNSKTKPKYIPQNYKYQLLVYAFLLIANGYKPTRMRLVYVNRYIDGGISEKTNKPLKSYPSEVTVLTEIITDEDIEFISGMLNHAKETLLATEKYPELTHLLWNDPRLKV